MGLLLSLLYLLLLLLSPADLFPELAAYRPNLVVLALAVVGTVIVLPSLRLDFRFPQHLLLFGFLGVVLFSWVTRGWLGGVLVSLQVFAPILAVYYLFTINLVSRWRLAVTAIVVIVVSVYYAIRGVLVAQFGIGPQDALMRTYTFNDVGDVLSMQGRIRGEGLFDDPNDLGQLFVVAIALAGYFYRGNLIKKLFMLGIIGLLVYGCYLTRSRGTLVGVASLLLGWMWTRGRVVLGLMLSGAAGLSLMALNFASGRAISFQSGQDRIMAWGEGFQMVKSNPIFGVGLNGFMEINGLTAHNSFVLCVAEQGLVGYFLWGAALCSTFMGAMYFLRAYRKEPAAEEYNDWLRTLLIALVGWVTTAWFLSRTYSPLLFLLLGMIVAVLTRAADWIDSRDSRAIDVLPLRAARWAPVTLGMMVISMGIVYLMLRLRVFL